MSLTSLFIGHTHVYAFSHEWVSESVVDVVLLDLHHFNHILTFKFLILFFIFIHIITSSIFYILVFTADLNGLMRLRVCISNISPIQLATLSSSYSRHESLSMRGPFTFNLQRGGSIRIVSSLASIYINSILITAVRSLIMRKFFLTSS